MRLCIFEDHRVQQLSPINLTRPTFELLCGRTSLYDKQIRQFPPSRTGALVRPHLVPLCQWLRPGLVVNELDWLCVEPTVLVNSRWLPDGQGLRDCTTSCVGMCAGEVAFAVVGPEQMESLRDRNLDQCLASWTSSLPQVPADGRMVNYLWELVHWNTEQISVDFEASITSPEGAPEDPDGRVHLNPEHLVGPMDRLAIHSSARIDPLVVADTTNGPVVVERDTIVFAFSRLEGPCVIGAGSHILGANIRHGTTIGPQCRIGGEVEESIVHGHTNKAHHGFLGHSYLGEWVNLGAGTCNSDLRNDYAEVTVVVNGETLPTGQRKVGCFVGDHTKTGLNVVLNTGSSIGAFCNLLPSGNYPPKYVPSFCNWWNGRLADNASVHRLLETAAIVMSRRGCTLTPAHSDLCPLLYEQTAADRRRALREGDQRLLRRSA